MQAARPENARRDREPPARPEARDRWIGDLFPAEVRTGSLAVDGADPAALRPEEAALAERFAPGRRRAFAAGRQCARGLLASLGCAEGPLLAGPERAPLWPDGVVGTISHGAGLCVVAVAARDVARGLGVDVESDAPLPERVRRRVCSDGEARWLARCREEEAGRLAKLLFSAKEAVYKCVHPLWRRPLGFRAVELELDRAAGAFRARALAAAGEGAEPILAALEGAFAFRGGRVLAGAILRAGRDA